MSQYEPGDPRETPLAKKRNRWVHLLWAVPLAAPFAAVLFVFGSLARCGIGQCNGGGFSQVATDSVQTVLFFFGSAAVLAFPFAVVPWVRRSVRLVGAAGIAALWFGYSWTQVR